jgi:DNA-binding NarL/FixJ family response regulator
MEQYMRILVVDKRLRIRSALRLLIEHATDHSVVAEVATSEKLTSTIWETAPDLVLLEWEFMREINRGMIATLKADHPQMKVVVLSGQPHCRKSAIDAGADHFMSKVDPPDRLLNILNNYE